MKGGRQEGEKEEKERGEGGTSSQPSPWAAFPSFLPSYLVKVWPLMGDKFLLHA